MRKIIIPLLCILLVGCSSSEKPQKIDATLMNHFPSTERTVLNEINPDVVTMQYLIDHSSDYATKLGSDRNDFFVIVHDIVEKIETEEYDDDILDRMDPEMADLLRGKTETNIFFPNCSIPLSFSEEDFKVGNEYYFYVTVIDGSTGYRYIPFKYFDFN